MYLFYTGLVCLWAVPCVYDIEINYHADYLTNLVYVLSSSVANVWLLAKVHGSFDLILWSKLFAQSHPIMVSPSFCNNCRLINRSVGFGPFFDWSDRDLIDRLLCGPTILKTNVPLMVKVSWVTEHRKKWDFVFLFWWIYRALWELLWLCYIL